jgi:prevent-host-death family protein
MKEITITEFRTKCSAILSRVQRTKKPIRITRRGKVIAEVVPLDPFSDRNWIGSMKGKMKILGDIVFPRVTNATGKFCGSPLVALPQESL